MENSMAPTNEKVNKYIPNDLAFSVLSKLSLKSLKRFECVCKSWTLLFENPNFVSMYRNNFISSHISNYDDTSLLLQEIISPFTKEEYSMFYLLSGERFENKVKLDLPPPFYEDGYDIKILGSGSINGTLCLTQRNTPFVLWNPANEEFKVIPLSPIEFVPPYPAHFWDRLGFGYDHIRDDYKVIRNVGFYPLIESTYYSLLQVKQPWNWEDLSDDPIWELYSLRSNSWKKLDANTPRDIWEIKCDQIYMDGICHWWGGEQPEIIKEYLVSFDLIDEVFFTTPMPSYMDKKFYSGLVHLVMLNGSVAFISNYAETTPLHISILGEPGVKESWTKLYIVDLLPSVERPPIEAGNKGIILFKREIEGKRLSWFDLNSQMIEEFDADIDGKWNRNIVIYKKNLIPTEGLND